jgi:hypothetical protein
VTRVPTLRITKQAAVIIAAAVVAVGVGIGTALLGGGGSGGGGGGGGSRAAGHNSSSTWKPVPSWCMDSPEVFNSPGEDGQCAVPVGCGHVDQIGKIEDMLTSENPIGSSGFGGTDDAGTLLKELQTINDQDRGQPHIHPVVKAGLDANAKDLQDEIDRYNAQQDWTDLNLNRLSSHTEGMVCIDFLHDTIDGKAPVFHTDHPTINVPTT